MVFERNQGLITFLGYLATVAIGGISLHYSNSRSTTATNLAKDQFKYELAKDSLNAIQEVKKDKVSEAKFRHQDSLNKHQNQINEQQLSYFKSQTLTAKQQLGYFKKQAEISETQFKHAELIYQNQLEENKPAFIIQEFTLDSLVSKPELAIRCKIYNSGKRGAEIKKITAFIWNPYFPLLGVDKMPVAGETLLPMNTNGAVIGIPKEIPFNENTLFMVQILYSDVLFKSIQTFRLFIRFPTAKSMENTQLDISQKNKILERIVQAEGTDNQSYLHP